MGGMRIRHLMLVAAAGALLAALAAPAWCLETSLAGISLGDTPEDLLASPSYGPPDAIFTPGNSFTALKGSSAQIPLWAVAVRMDQVAGDQVHWVYNRDPMAVGVLFTGTGINAHVTAVAVSEWRNFKPSKIAETSKGIRIGDAFADLLETYGWPNRMEITAESGTQVSRPVAAARPAAALPVGPALPPSGSIIDRASAFSEEEDQGGPGPLPPVGVAGGMGSGAPGTTTASGGTAFSKSCIISYPSVDFILYRMAVFRIQIYGR